MRFALFLASLCHRQGGLKCSFTNLRAQLVDSLLRQITFSRPRLLPNHLIVVDYCGAIIFLFIVKFRHLVGAVRLLVLKNIQVCPRLSGLLAMRIMEKEILESCPGIRGCRRVRGALPCSREPNITDLVLCVGCNRLVWEFVYHCLVRFDCHLGNVLFLARKTNVKLRTRCVFPIWRSTDNRSEERRVG